MSDRELRVLVASGEPAFCQHFGPMILEVAERRCRMFECHAGHVIPKLAAFSSFDLFIPIMNNLDFPKDVALLQRPWEPCALLIKELKRRCGIPVIAYCGLGSTYGGDVWLSEAEKAGADFAFTLPWNAGRFRAAVSSCLMLE